MNRYKVIHLPYKHDQIQAVLNDMSDKGWKFITLSDRDIRTLGVFERESATDE